MVSAQQEKTAEENWRSKKLSLTPHLLQMQQDEYGQRTTCMTALQYGSVDVLTATLMHPLLMHTKKVQASWLREPEKHGVRPEKVSSILLNEAI